MAGSAADTPTTPEYFRVSDAERDRAVDELKKEFVDGRLSHETFMLRMHAALGARNHGQLSSLFNDLPPRPSRAARVRRAMQDLRRRTREAMAEGASAVADGFRGLVPRQRGGYAEDEGDPAAEVPAPVVPPQPLMFPSSSDPSFTIGRDQRCDLYIPDMSVSRLHAKLVRDAEGWLLSDLGSTNGTRLNGWRVRAAVPVRAGDHILFGSAAFVLQPRPRDSADPGHGAGPPDGDGQQTRVLPRYEAGPGPAPSG
jgi:hypothetical protein